MFIFIFITFILLCFFASFTVYKIVEIEKDINTLYDNYSEELKKVIKINANRGVS